MGSHRIEVRWVLEMSELNHCISMISMHQAGIKKNEGRTWRWSHRGRLWIAATAEPVDMKKQTENFDPMLDLV